LIESKTPGTTLSRQSPTTTKRIETTAPSSAHTAETNKKSVKSEDQKSKKPDEKGKSTKSDEQKAPKNSESTNIFHSLILNTILYLKNNQLKQYLQQNKQHLIRIKVSINLILMSNKHFPMI